jgi:WD40 repeat protein
MAWEMARIGRVVFGALLLAVLALGPAARASAAGGSVFEPIVIQRLGLPAQIKDASTPVFTRDGRHLLFFSAEQLRIVGTNGKGLSCLSCGLANEPTLPKTEQEGFATEFPDRKRVFFGAAGSLGVLECSPSVIDCVSRKILPVDLSAARPNGGVLTGGAVNPLGTLDIGGGSSPKLAPDGVHIAFSDVRSDAAELMIIATLQRQATKYVVTDPRVINPAGPTSITDTNTQAWSDSSALYEFKTFADGGADATYVEVGGPATLNPDVWEVNLATGKRTRLTANPDWDEDDAPSPDGRSIVVESDRTMHRTDMLGGLLPVRGFIDAPQVAIYASYYVQGPVDRQCDLQPWLLPASGDDGAKLLGEPIQPYTGGDVHAANNVSGWPQWSPNGTEIALNTESYTTNLSAPYLLIAHLVARKPTKPLPIVSSQPGAWAPSPQNYHGAIQSEQPVLLHGLASGTVLVTYDGLGILSGEDSAIYDDYSDNGRDFINGTSTVSYPNILTGPITIHTDLTMTGADTGYSHIDLTLTGTDTSPVTATGTAVTNYDGTTVSGPPHTPAPCPRALPRPPQLRLATRLTRRRGHEVILAHVTASIAGAGANEAGTDARPLLDATVAVEGVRARTNEAGNATLAIPAPRRSRATITARAGDTFLPVSSTIAVRPRRGRRERVHAPALTSS